MTQNRVVLLSFAAVIYFAVASSKAAAKAKQPCVTDRVTTLETTVHTLSNLLNSQANMVKTLTNDLNKAKSDLAAADKQLNDKLAKNTQLISGVRTTANQALQKAGKWPAGHYCIFQAGGSCPSGFTARSGYMKAISLYAANSNYITPRTFGDSKIQCHGRCGQYGHWAGELHIFACCK